MSYDINVVRSDNKELITLKKSHGIHGGTYCVGGTTEAWLNMTYNYGKYLYKLWPTDGVRYLIGKPLDEVITLLGEAVKKLHGSPSDNYWEATEGNARDALFKLRLLCEMCEYENPDLKMELEIH